MEIPKIGSLGDSTYPDPEELNSISDKLYFISSAIQGRFDLRDLFFSVWSMKIKSEERIETHNNDNDGYVLRQ